MADKSQVIYLREYTWWQSPVDAALALLRAAGFDAAKNEIDAQTGAVRVWFKLPAGMSEDAAYNRLVSFTGARDVPAFFVAEESGVIALPAPTDAPWYTLLQEPTPGAPMAKVYCVEDHVTHSRSSISVYKSVDKDHPPQFSDKDTRTHMRGDAVEVWHRPVSGSKWVCVYDHGDLTLWMWADDLLPVKPPA